MILWRKKLVLQSNLAGVSNGHTQNPIMPRLSRPSSVTGFRRSSHRKQPTQRRKRPALRWDLCVRVYLEVLVRPEFHGRVERWDLVEIGLFFPANGGEREFRGGDGKSVRREMFGGFFGSKVCFAAKVERGGSRWFYSGGRDVKWLFCPLVLGLFWLFWVLSLVISSSSINVMDIGLHQFVFVFYFIFNHFIVYVKSTFYVFFFCWIWNFCF